MKKLFLSFLALLSFVSVAFAISVPSSYNEIYSEDGYSIYKKNNIYVSVVDLTKTDIKFGNVNKASSSNSFYKYKLDDWWNIIGGSKIAIFNGQFFNIKKNPSPLSFPLRSNYTTLVTQTDPGDMKTLQIYNNGREAQINYGYNSYYLNNSKELMVGLNPTQNMDKDSEVGRFYIGGLNDNSSSLRYLLFFISVAATQNTMDNEISKWGVMEHNTIMMDGSGSAQMKSNSMSVYGSNGFFVDKRKLANIISITRIWK